MARYIYSWDRFLLCASKNSLTSDWVEDEIKTTLERERALGKERGKPILNRKRQSNATASSRHGRLDLEECRST
jgi:hypothetical protein